MHVRGTTESHYPRVVNDKKHPPSLRSSVKSLFPQSDWVVSATFARQNAERRDEVSYGVSAAYPITLSPAFLRTSVALKLRLNRYLT
ncbi:unnamed protein product, partial [Iphiclides podalirius]